MPERAGRRTFALILGESRLSGGVLEAPQPGDAMARRPTTEDSHDNTPSMRSAAGETLTGRRELLEREQA